LRAGDLARSPWGSDAVQCRRTSKWGWSDVFGGGGGGDGGDALFEGWWPGPFPTGIRRRFVPAGEGAAAEGGGIPGKGREREGGTEGGRGIEVVTNIGRGGGELWEGWGGRVRRSIPYLSW
jgi:hypothetical protein